MVDIKCLAQGTIKLGQLSPFQGELKQRSVNDIKALADSIRTEGMKMPFAVWQHDGVNSLLDGHGRLAALIELALQDRSIESQDFPVIYISADSEDEAKKALLQITSSYGKITKQGVVKFCASIPTYKAPAINKFVHKPKEHVKVEKPKTESVIKISVPTDKVQAILDVLKQVSYIKVL